MPPTKMKTVKEAPEPVCEPATITVDRFVPVIIMRVINKAPDTELK
jgi:hypothetical protein